MQALAHFCNVPNNRSFALLSIRVTHHDSFGLSGIVWRDIFTHSHDRRSQVSAFQTAKSRGELPTHNPHIMKEPERSCFVESVLPGAEKSLQNIRPRHEQKPEWCGDIESVQRWYCVTNTTGQIFVSPACERFVNAGVSSFLQCPQ